MNEKEKQEWMKTTSTNIVTMPDGEKVSLTMTKWHWMSLGWMTETMNTDAKIVIERARALDDGQGIDRGAQDFIEGFIDACDREGMLV